ncbi:MAG: hypothetical protein EGP82_02600 [Odoribacter splanchnicus]|nr:hypothetical protein [Odoribacter splanchnicus]
MSLGLICFFFAGGLCSCEKELIEYGQGDVKVCIEQGEEWLHDFPVLLGMKKKNPPQIAIWLEDRQGNYLSTVYVTHKIATQSWQSAHGSRRKEALPHWCHARGVAYEDGLYLPTEDRPLTDGISGATPREGFEVKLRPANTLGQFVVKIEINHSTDFNESYPKSAREGEANYSGGKEGSGQPALVYSADVDPASGNRSFEATLIGHSSPDGSSGDVFEDVSGLTTALHIVKRITINIQ